QQGPRALRHAAPGSVWRRDQPALRITAPSGPFSSPQPNASTTPSPAPPLPATPADTQAPHTTNPRPHLHKTPNKKIPSCRSPSDSGVQGRKRNAPVEHHARRGVGHTAASVRLDYIMTRWRKFVPLETRCRDDEEPGRHLREASRPRLVRGVRLSGKVAE